MPTEIWVAIIGLLGVISTSIATVLGILLKQEKAASREDRAIAQDTITTLRVEVGLSGCSSPSCPSRSPVVAITSTASGVAPAGKPSDANPNNA